MYSLTREERLRSFARIDTVFHSGESFMLYPLSVRYIVKSGNGKVALLFACPKRYQKHAVKRNRIKRLMREAYRLNSSSIKDFALKNNIDIDFTMTYVSKETVDFVCMQNKVIEVLNRLCLCKK